MLRTPIPGRLTRPAVWLACCLSTTLPAADHQSLEEAHRPDLTELSLEQLMDVEVTSVSRKEEPLFNAPSAVTIITGEDIRRSGAQTIPEALRLAPGLQVAQVDAHNWAVSSRGFNDLFATKLLVLMDGRSVYTPLFSGVFWDIQDTALEDIDRIEVIRGPGATLWGANAVNGVINILTRRAKETQGVLLSGGAGTEDRGFTTVRYGGQLGEDLYYRVYGKYFDRDNSRLPSGRNANDDWNMARTGFRMDWEPVGPTVVTFQGDLYYGELDQTYFLPSLTAPTPRTERTIVDVGGGNVLGRWTHAFSADSDMKFQLYYDLTKRDSPVIDESRDALDLDFQHRLRPLSPLEIVWGAGYRWDHDRQDGNNLVLTMDPAHQTTDLYSTFAQGSVDIVPDRLKLTLGTKLEHNDYTGLELQPSSRLTWQLDTNHTVWAAISRSVRTPSRVENDGAVTASVIPGLPPTAVTLLGNSHYDSEALWAYELGYRLQPHPRVSVDTAVFYNDYDRLRSFQLGTPFLNTAAVPPYTVAPFRAVNDMEGQTYGTEIAVEYSPVDDWRWRANYTYLEMQLDLPNAQNDPFSQNLEGTSPQHQVGLQSSFDLPGHLQLDLLGRFVDAVHAFSIPSYFSLSARLGWQPTDFLEVSVVGQNLLDDQHPEFRSTFISTEPTELERSVYGKITFKF